jgi:hypothetical protein
LRFKWDRKRGRESLGTTCLFLWFNYKEPNKIQGKYYFLSYFPGGYGWKKIKLWQSADYSLNFKANVDELFFALTGSLAHAHAHYSGGLLFLGLCLNQ